MLSKYIRLQWAGFVVWDGLAPLSHAQMKKLLVDPMPDFVVSAGFVEIRDGRPHCHGHSDSLGVASRPDDSAVLGAQLGLRPPAAAVAAAVAS